MGLKKKIMKKKINQEKIKLSMGINLNQEKIKLSMEINLNQEEIKLNMVIKINQLVKEIIQDTMNQLVSIKLHLTT